MELTRDDVEFKREPVGRRPPHERVARDGAALAAAAASRSPASPAPSGRSSLAALDALVALCRVRLHDRRRSARLRRRRAPLAAA